MRALEVAGYIGIMLAGAFPMVYLIRKYLSKPIEFVGRKIGLDATGAAGMLAAAANILAMFRLVKDMRPRDKVLCIAFAVCAAFTFGDHLAFTTNFQPTLLLPVMVGKLGGGMCGFLIATWLCVPKALELEEKDMIDNVHIVLKHVPALKDRVPTAIIKLRGGLTNTIYKVEYGNDAYVVRMFGPGTELLGIDREREHAVSVAVAAAGVAPEIVGYLPKGSITEIDDFQGASVVHFIVGKLLDEADARKPETLQRIVTTLKTCHAAPVGEDLGEPFSVFKIVRHYVDEAKKNKVALPASLNDALANMDRIEKEVGTTETPCLCHNDLLAGNFIDDGTTMRVIDWEYGGMGDRYFDLGNFAVNLQMTDEQETAFLRAYFGEATPASLRRLKMMRLASDLREATWSYLQSALSKLKSPQYYMERGNEHLERFRKEAKASGLVS
jgi:thiamine kinase-like enzyme